MKRSERCPITASMPLVSSKMASFSIRHSIPRTRLQRSWVWVMRQSDLFPPSCQLCEGMDSIDEVEGMVATTNKVPHLAKFVGLENGA